MGCLFFRETASGLPGRFREFTERLRKSKPFKLFASANAGCSLYFYKNPVATRETGHCRLVNVVERLFPLCGGFFAIDAQHVILEVDLRTFRELAVVFPVAPDFPVFQLELVVVRRQDFHTFARF